MVQQTAGVHQVVRDIKTKADAGEVSSTDLGNVQRRYNELVRTHDAWRDQVEHVINNEIDNFESVEQYQNAVSKLENASQEFAKAADAALGGSTHTTVPDWPDEARGLIVNAYNERKL